MIDEDRFKRIDFLFRQLKKNLLDGSDPSGAELVARERDLVKGCLKILDIAVDRYRDELVMYNKNAIRLENLDD